MTRYEVVPFRTSRSKCPECDSNILHLRPQFLELGDDLPSFFLCTTCNYVGQTGVAKLWPEGGSMKLPEDPKVSLADLPRRETKEEVCEHCGATYTGLFHCQSLSQIKEIDDYEFIGVISEWTPPERDE